MSSKSYTEVGNTKMVSYGIQTDDSEVRIHVCVLAGKVYVFSTRKGLRAIDRGNYRQREVFNQKHGIVAALGYAVPVADLQPNEVDARKQIARQNFSDKDDESTKGKKAEAVVQELMDEQRILLPVKARVVTDTKSQYAGVDLIALCALKVQVKCDYRGGVGEGCTGNLFLQTAECNPDKVS